MRRTFTMIAVTAAAAGLCLASTVWAQQVIPGAQPLPPGTQVIQPGTQPLPPGAQVLPPGTQPLPPGARPIPSGAQPVQPGVRPGPVARQAGQAPVNDRLFVMAAAVGGLAELTTGNLALQRTENQEIRQFAQRMIDDHTRANQELTAIAGAKRFPVPTAPDTKDQAAADRINGLQGADFDREFSKVQVVAHLDAVALFQAEAERGRDADLKAFAAKTLPTLREHLRTARQLAGQGGERPEASKKADHTDRTPKDDDRSKDDESPK
jgi:putative membrane protein